VVIDVIHDVVTQARGDALPTPTPVPSLSPSPRGYHAMAYDVESDRVLLFGDIILSSEDQVVQFAETRAHDPGTGTWEVMDSTELPCTEGCPVAYDIQSDRVVMLHGFTADLETWDWEAVSDTWAYDYNTDTWTNMEPAETPIELRLGPNMVYDAESDRMIMFGGLDPENWEFHNDTWAYDLDSNTWTKMDPEVSPSGRDYFAMTYDAGSDRVILFGGAAEPIAGDTWSYDYNTDTWEELQPAEAPAPREYSAMVYDAGSDRVILFGGENESKANVVNDIWAYDFDSNTWTELEPDVSPSERGWHAMVYSTKAKQVVVLGGGRSRQTYTDETWTYDSAADTWTNLTPDS
jgi:N-acetylneuraminic acid mutarotase